jgi:hypothetical protein
MDKGNSLLVDMSIFLFLDFINFCSFAFLFKINPNTAFILCVLFSLIYVPRRVYDSIFSKKTNDNISPRSVNHERKFNGLSSNMDSNLSFLKRNKDNILISLFFTLVGFILSTTWK